MESGAVNPLNIRKAVEANITEKVRLMADVELEKALKNAQNSYAFLESQEQERGRKANSASRPSEIKEQKRELVEIMEAIDTEQRKRQVKN